MKKKLGLLFSAFFLVTVLFSAEGGKEEQQQIDVLSVFAGTEWVSGDDPVWGPLETKKDISDDASWKGLEKDLTKSMADLSVESQAPKPSVEKKPEPSEFYRNPPPFEVCPYTKDTIHIKFLSRKVFAHQPIPIEQALKYNMSIKGVYLWSTQGNASGWGRVHTYIISPDTNPWALVCYQATDEQYYKIWVPYTTLFAAQTD